MMTTTIIVFLILSFIIGGIIAWFLAKARLQGIYTNQITELEKRASGAEARIVRGCLYKKWEIIK